MCLTRYRKVGSECTLRSTRCGCRLCSTLKRFLTASNQMHLEWPLANEQRVHIHRIVDAHDMPVSHTTRRLGRPYTLVQSRPMGCSSGRRQSAGAARGEKREWSTSDSIAGRGLPQPVRSCCRPLEQQVSWRTAGPEVSTGRGEELFGLQNEFLCPVPRDVPGNAVRRCLTLVVRIQEPPVELGIQIACLREFLPDRGVYGAMATEAQLARGQQSIGCVRTSRSRLDRPARS